MSEGVVTAIRERLGSKAKALDVRSARRVYVDVESEDLVEVASVLFGDMKARYAIASGMQTAEGFEVLHHFAFDAEHVVVSVRVRTGPADPQVESIATVIKGAEFIEREMRDLLGIEFPEHPNPKRLILSDDWPEGVYPLRRGEPWKGKVRKGS